MNCTLGQRPKKRYIPHSVRNVTCDAVSWTLMNQMERAPVTWDTKILRKMYGPMYENNY